MGNNNFKPQMAFSKNQVVEIKGAKFSDEHVAKEVKSLGRGGVVIHTTKLHCSRPNSHPVYVSRVKIANKYETFLTTDLVPKR